MELPIITCQDELLGLLREAPAARVVALREDRFEVWECEKWNPARLSRQLAVIANHGTATMLLSEAHQMDFAGDIDEWRAVPLRYGPLCGIWVLPEHPQAPRMPG